MPEASFHKRLLDNLHSALLLVEPSLCISFINSSAQMLFALSESRALGMSLEQLFPQQQALLQDLQEAARDNSPYTNRGIVLSLSGGHDITVDLVVTPYHDEQASAAGLILEFQPIDRFLRISREEGLISSHQTTRALIRGLAHEIKNPLGGVRGAAQLLSRQLNEPSLQEYTSIIISEADRLRDLVDRLLGPHHQPQLAAVNIHEVLEHVRNLVRAEAGDEITFNRDYDPSLPEIMADRSQLIQAILNVVRNAMQATAGNTGERIITLCSRVQRRITIGSHSHRLVCRLDISDNGRGIPAELEDSIFVPMVSGRAEGTGLGLAISQSIVSQHKGIIEHSSEPGWTHFTMYLPLDVEHADEC